MKHFVSLLLLLLLFFGCASTDEKSPEKQNRTKESKSGFSLELETVDGKEFSFESIKGKKHLLIAFWATWCEPCKEELMQMAKMYDEFSDEFEFVAISTDGEDLIDKVNEFAAESSLPFPVLIDPSGNTVSSLIPGGDTVPYSIIVLKDGTIHSKHSGYQPGDEVNLKKELQELIDKKK